MCSRSHQPAPTPTNALPPVSAERVAAALAVTPGARNVTGVTRVPSCSRVVEAASAPSVTHGSGIGSHARPTCGIWTRWSIRAMPASPACSAAATMSRSHVSRSPSAGKCESWSTTPRRPVRPAGDVVARATASPAAAGASSGASSGATRTTCHPSPSSRSTVDTTAASWLVRTRAGTGRSRAELRERHTPAGVSRTTATAGRPAARAAASQPRRRDTSVPSVSTTVVRPRPRRAATTCSSSAKASVEASRSCSPLPTTSRRASDETISAER